MGTPSHFPFVQRAQITSDYCNKLCDLTFCETSLPFYASDSQVRIRSNEWRPPCRVAGAGPCRRKRLHCALTTTTTDHHHSPPLTSHHHSPLTTTITITRNPPSHHHSPLTIIYRSLRTTLHATLITHCSPPPFTHHHAHHSGTLILQRVLLTLTLATASRACA